LYIQFQRTRKRLSLTVRPLPVGSGFPCGSMCHHFPFCLIYSAASSREPANWDGPVRRDCELSIRLAINCFCHNSVSDLIYVVVLLQPAGDLITVIRNGGQVQSVRTLMKEEGGFCRAPRASLKARREWSFSFSHRQIVQQCRPNPERKPRLVIGHRHQAAHLYGRYGSKIAQI